DAGPVHRLRDRADQPRAAGLVREAGAVATRAGAQDLAVDVGPAADGVVVVFDDERRRTFADDGAVAVEVERSASMLGIVGPAAETLAQAHPGDIDGVDVAAAGTDDHRAGGPTFDAADRCV